jgi:hypothetical protein
MRHFIIIEIGPMAVGRLRGLVRQILIVPGVPLRSTPGSILPPAPQAENVNNHFAQIVGNDKSSEWKTGNR